MTVAFLRSHLPEDPMEALDTSIWAWVFYGRVSPHRLYVSRVGIAPTVAYLVDTPFYTFVVTP